MSISERVSVACEAKKIRQVDLILNRLGSKQTISFILNGKQKPNAIFLEEFVKMVPDLNARWLLTGEGEMFAKDEKNIDIKGGQTIFSDKVAQYGNKNTMQKSGNDNEELLSLRKELEFKTKELELQQKQLNNQDKLIARYEKLLDK